jgi:hypothetical protein
MDKELSERRLVENELMFREPNEKLAIGFTQLKAMAEEEGDGDLHPNPDDPIPFYCECADAKCSKRINLRPSEYLKLHKASTQFVVLPGHSIPEIEKIITATRKYEVVEKYKVPEVQPTKNRLLKRSSN